MVTDGAQKLYCVGEVFWGQLPPLSEGSSTSRPLKGREKQLGLVIEGPSSAHAQRRSQVSILIVRVPLCVPSGGSSVSGRCEVWILSLGLSVWKLTDRMGLFAGLSLWGERNRAFLSTGQPFDQLRNPN